MAESRDFLDGHRRSGFKAFHRLTLRGHSKEVQSVGLRVTFSRPFPVGWGWPFELRLSPRTPNVVLPGWTHTCAQPVPVLGAAWSWLLPAGMWPPQGLQRTGCRWPVSLPAA